MGREHDCATLVEHESNNARRVKEAYTKHRLDIDGSNFWRSGHVVKHSSITVQQKDAIGSRGVAIHAVHAVVCTVVPRALDTREHALRKLCEVNVQEVLVCVHGRAMRAEQRPFRQNTGVGNLPPHGMAFWYCSRRAIRRCCI